MVEEKVMADPIKLDLACGQNKQKGFIGADIYAGPDVDVVIDLEKFPWEPWADESVGEIFCSHYVEHTPDLIKFMDECYRILVFGGKMTVIAPYYSSMRCWQDPTHKRAISEMSFMYFWRKWRVDNRLDHYPIKSDFDFTWGYALDPAVAARSEEARAFAVKHYHNAVADIHVTLTKTKREPEKSAK
jgi:SAM-dependent methyltransferase